MYIYVYLHIYINIFFCEPCEEGRDIEFPRQISILTDCTIINECYALWHLLAELLALNVIDLRASWSRERCRLPPTNCNFGTLHNQYHKKIDINIHIYICMKLPIYVDLYTYRYIYVYINIYIYKYIYTYTYIHVYIYKYLYICMHIYMIYMYIYVYIRIYI